ncbi:uncharacterized protein K452DRAFT_301934 [Aplosporella prunicola CBS 121167]|uniref:25S rRNA (Uridine(2843)-N(3))-methyltransferase n=1 Tax=Aplosporella prunicola CBS 121167 TaxID=1176127 RepID=A0A6A6B028_9PEZI|nr:uncharacterized protein K452DRAFT_301934 [Aplosporella prunicola CBS 121167]KAF2137552.1 hypothetical protein K452DRAFT_301934 [Aplosporella prunicola CBS 121167]
MAPPKPSAKSSKTPASKNKSQKKSVTARSEAKPDQLPPPAIPLELQQLLLNVFRNAFPERLGPELKPLLQEVKQHLYNRDFLHAFGKDEYLEVYALRWSPSRALGYAQIFDDLSEYLVQELGSVAKDAPRRIVCLGGGAGAEIVGLAGYLKLLERKNVLKQVASSDDTEKTVEGAPSTPHFDVVAIDIANWSSIVAGLQQAITTPPTLSKYASAAAKEANVELLQPDVLQTRFVQQDVLTMPLEDLSRELKDTTVVTLMFTLNELYSTSLAKTQSFLLRLTGSLQPGALLLVVDSPGSYSSVTLNGAEKKYPMHWLLDHTLLSTPQGAKPQDADAKWEKLLSDESKWFRLPEGLKYPIELENMRYQIHLYRRLP